MTCSISAFQSITVMPITYKHSYEFHLMLCPPAFLSYDYLSTASCYLPQLVFILSRKEYGCSNVL